MREVIKKDRVRVGEPDARVAGAHEASHVPLPAVRLVRLEGRVQAIELTCRCGEVTILEIEYDDTTPVEVTS